MAILDADKEGFLRSERSLIQTSGRAARNVGGQVIMYADTITASIRACLDVTRRRREIQARYNEENGITPESINTEIHQLLGSVYEADYVTVQTVSEKEAAYASEKELPAVIRKLKEEMKAGRERAGIREGGCPPGPDPRPDEADGRDGGRRVIWPFAIGKAEGNER